MGPFQWLVYLIFPPSLSTSPYCPEGQGCTVNPHYSRIPYLQFAYSLNLFVIPNQYSKAYTDIRRRVPRGKNLSHLKCTFPAKAEEGDCLPSCFSSYCKQVSLCGPLCSIFFHIFVIFVGDFAVEMAPGVVLKCYLVSPHAGAL